MAKANNGDVRTLWKAVKITSTGRINQNNSFNFGLNEPDTATKLNKYFTAITTDPDYDILAPISFKPTSDSDIPRLPELGSFDRTKYDL